jgi:hypothetical protein
MKNDSMLAAVAVNANVAGFVSHYSPQKFPALAAECARSRATPRNAVVVKASNGFARAWLCAWPDGRTTVALVAL